jgi:DNA-binding response OmpR family regulator
VLADRQAISVLLVDDQRLVGAAFERLLEDEPDIELHCCYKAGDAVARANQIGATVILQDLVRPGADGLAMVRMFRANSATARTPIILLSGNDDSGIRARALAGGADDYLVKPPAKIDLVACIRRHATAAGALDSGDRTAASVHVTPASDQAASETLDRRVIAEFREGSTPGAPDFALMLIDEFVKEGASQLALLRDAQQQQDVRALKTLAHSLKGSSLTMGARRLATLCTQMEAHADLHPGSAVTSALMTELDREFARVRAALEAERQGASQL